MGEHDTSSPSLWHVVEICIPVSFLRVSAVGVECSPGSSGAQCSSARMTRIHQERPQAQGSFMGRFLRIGHIRDNVFGWWATIFARFTSRVFLPVLAHHPPFHPGPTVVNNSINRLVVVAGLKIPFNQAGNGLETFSSFTKCSANVRQLLFVRW